MFKCGSREKCKHFKKLPSEFYLGRFSKLKIHRATIHSMRCLLIENSSGGRQQVKTTQIRRHDPWSEYKALNKILL